MPRPRHPRREGVLLGLVVATSIWLWLAVVDAIAGQPFRTFIVLGGIASFTLLHYALCLAYGLAAVAVVPGAQREPSRRLGGSSLGRGWERERLGRGREVGAVLRHVGVARREPAVQLHRAAERVFRRAGQRHVEQHGCHMHGATVE